MDRSDVSFASAGTRCAAWLYRPTDRSDPLPCVILAHGFSATRHERIPAFAEHFAANGLASLCFDYRHFGDSEGNPRQLISIRRQLADWRAAVAFARGLDGIDAARIALWGSSFSGGHVITVAASDESIAAVIAQMPFTDGVATLRALGAKRVLRATPHAIIDSARGLVRLAPHYIPAVAAPGDVGMMTTADSEPGFASLVPPDSTWRNEVTARTLLSVPFYRPGRRAKRVRAPLFVAVVKDDSLTPSQPAVRFAERAPHHEINEYPGGHFDPYTGPTFDRLVSDETKFLKVHLTPVP
jgi:fermentation-respiration switch protein FrsA (DUF1100 family)